MRIKYIFITALLLSFNVVFAVEQPQATGIEFWELVTGVLIPIATVFGVWLGIHKISRAQNLHIKGELKLKYNLKDFNFFLETLAFYMAEIQKYIDFLEKLNIYKRTGESEKVKEILNLISNEVYQINFSFNKLNLLLVQNEKADDELFKMLLSINCKVLNSQVDDMVNSQEIDEFIKSLKDENLLLSQKGRKYVLMLKKGFEEFVNIDD